MKRGKVLKVIGNGRFFSVKFIKRTTGEVRVLNGRTGVKKALGSTPVYKDEDYDLVTVWDMQKHGYRKIPVDNILEIKANGDILYAADSSSERVLHQRT